MRDVVNHLRDLRDEAARQGAGARAVQLWELATMAMRVPEKWCLEIASEPTFGNKPAAGRLMDLYVAFGRSPYLQAIGVELAVLEALAARGAPALVIERRAREHALARALRKDCAAATRLRVGRWLGFDAATFRSMYAARRARMTPDMGDWLMVLRGATRREWSVYARVGQIYELASEVPEAWIYELCAKLADDDIPARGELGRLAAIRPRFQPAMEALSWLVGRGLPEPVALHAAADAALAVLGYDFEDTQVLANVRRWLVDQGYGETFIAALVEQRGRRKVAIEDAMQRAKDTTPYMPGCIKLDKETSQ